MRRPTRVSTSRVRTRPTSSRSCSAWPSASAQRTPEGVVASVRPVLVPQSSLMSAVSGAMNALSVEGVFSGRTLYCGAGAGARPTASAVVADLMDVARGRRLGGVGRVPPLGTPELAEGGLGPAACETGGVYLRLSAPPDR